MWRWKRSESRHKDFTCSLVEIKPLNSLDLRTVAFGTVRMWREVTGLILSKLLILQKEQFENTFYIIIYITNYHDLKLERNTQLSLFLIVSIIFGWLYPESKIFIMEFIILKEMVCTWSGFSTTYCWYTSEHGKIFTNVQRNHNKNNVKCNPLPAEIAFYFQLKNHNRYYFVRIEKKMKFFTSIYI